MRFEVVVRRASQAVAASCLVGAVVAAGCRDWPDMVLIGLLGAFAVVTARKMAWQLRPSVGGGAYSAWPASASASRVRPAAPMSSSCSSNHTVWYESTRGRVNHEVSPAWILSSADDSLVE
jgi:hypothetical protein